MANWRCGASACGGRHPDSATRCPTGSWQCGRITPACSGHAHPSDRHETGTAWTCGADECPRNHSQPSHNCDHARWHCGRQTPPCAGHGDRTHICRGDLTVATEDAESFSCTTPVTTPISQCDTADRIRVVEIVEVVTHGGRTTTQAVAARKQFINLDNRVDSGRPHPDFGRQIKLKARVEWASGDRSRPLAGHNVYWRIASTAGNKAGLPNASKASFDSADSAGPRTTQKSNTTDVQGWTEPVDFFLSLYGGDSFNVYATENSGHAGGKCAGLYTVWKKFWYQVTEMSDGTAAGVFDLPAAVTTALESGCHRSFIELDEQPPRTRANHVSDLEDHDARRNAANPHFRDDSFCPFKAQITTVDCSESKQESKTVQDVMRTPTWQSRDYIQLWRQGTAILPWKRQAEYRLMEELKWTCARVGCPSDHDTHGERCDNLSGRTWHCGAQGCPRTHPDPTEVCPGASPTKFRCNRVSPACGGHPNQNEPCPDAAGSTWNCGELHCPTHRGRTDVCGGSTSWTDIPAANLSVQADQTRRGFKKLVVNFSAGPVYPSATRRVEIRISYLQVQFASIAFGWGGSCQQFFLCTGMLQDYLPNAEWIPTQSSDCPHEFGHALGLVNMAPLATSHAHDAWLDGSHANHCNKQPAQCVMYWASSTARATTFHLDGGTGCSDHLRRQDFSRSVMAGYWR